MVNCCSNKKTRLGNSEVALQPTDRIHLVNSVHTLDTLDVLELNLLILISCKLWKAATSKSKHVVVDVVDASMLHKART